MLWMLSDMLPLTSDRSIIPMTPIMRSKQKAILI
jgi:hypothetical protein